MSVWLVLSNKNTLVKEMEKSWQNVNEVNMSSFMLEVTSSVLIKRESFFKTMCCVWLNTKLNKIVLKWILLEN